MNDSIIRELRKILVTMDVPPVRIDRLNHPDPEWVHYTVKWLNRNLGFRNSDHPKFPEAKKMIVQLLRKRLS